MISRCGDDALSIALDELYDGKDAAALAMAHMPLVMERGAQYVRLVTSVVLRFNIDVSSLVDVTEASVFSVSGTIANLILQCKVLAVD